MPGHVKKVEGGYVVIWGGKRMSKEALSEDGAKAQLRALYANEKVPPPPSRK